MRRPLRFYLVGGAAIVDQGMRDATVDVDFVVDADDPAAIDEFERLVPELKNELNINLEPASPADFLPVPPGALDRSLYARTYGAVTVYYYDPVATAISKIARGAERDLSDVRALLASERVTWEQIESMWRQMRASPRGWVRYDPETVERRIRTLRGQHP